MTNQETLERHRQRPWRRVLVPDDGVVAALAPELPGCFAEGRTYEEALSNLEESIGSWLAAAVDSGADIPEPEGESEPVEFSGRFSVRLPRSLHRRLAERASTERCSLNQLVSMTLAEALGTSRSTSVAPATDAYEDITADAVAGGSDAIGALKGIATFLRDRGDVNLACLVYGYAAERVATGPEGAQGAAREFGTAGSLARRERRLRLAESLWRQSLRLDVTNVRSRSSLGQLLHHEGRYEEAVEFLEPVAEVDDYARLFLGWSRLQLGLASPTPKQEVVTLGLADVVSALRRWCAYGPRADRDPWLRQVRRLYVLGPQFRQEVGQLVSFANANANWDRVSEDEVRAGGKPDDGGEVTLEAVPAGPGRQR